MASWHEATINDMKQSLIDDDSVRGLVVIGSCARSDATPDAWSDLDKAIRAQTS